MSHKNVVLNLISYTNMSSVTFKFEVYVIKISLRKNLHSICILDKLFSFN
jgi:hypothetical protein